MSTFKKKKRSFLQKAKRYGKEGNYGRGKRLSEQEYHYYIRVFEQLKHVEKEEKDTLIRNFFREMEKEGNIKSLATNQIVSRILDDTLPLAPVSKIIAIIKVFSEDLRLFCVDPFASHVLQTLLTLSLKYIQETAMQKKWDTGNEESDEVELIPLSEDQREEFMSFILKSSKFVYNNLNEFVCETYASHVVRTVLEVCSGAEVSKSVKCSQKAQTFHSIRDDPKQILTVPNELSTVITDFVSRIVQLPNFTDVITNECGSTVLQTTLLVLSATGDTEKSSMLVNHIIEYGFDRLENQNSGIHPLFEYNSTSRLMEVTLSSAMAKQQDQIFTAFVSGEMAEIVKHKLGNFTVQRLLSSWKMKESFSVLYDSVSMRLHEAFSAGNTGVVFSFVQACRRLGTHQARCLKRIMELLDCLDSEASQMKLSSLLLYFLPLKDFEAKKQTNQLPPLSLHGTLILQELVNFNKPIKVVNSLLEMPSSELVRMICDPRGSHIPDAFVKSQFVGETSKVKLICKLEGNLVTLACNKHGSRSLETLWNSVGVKMRTKICRELFESSSKLRENTFGTIIYNNFQIRFFNKNERKDWEEIQQKEYKRRQFLTNLLEETDELAQPVKKKKKKS